MNWFKNANVLAWQGKEFYHLVNVMKFEIDSFPRLTLDEGRGHVSPTMLTFYIVRDDGKEYVFAVRKSADSVSTNITTKPDNRILGTNTYAIAQYTPQQIIENGLTVINNDYGEGFYDGMV